MKIILNSYIDPNNAKIAIVTLSVDNPDKKINNEITTQLDHAIKYAYDLAKICVELDINNEDDLLKEQYNGINIKDLFHPYKGSVNLINVELLDANEVFDRWLSTESFRYGV